MNLHELIEKRAKVWEGAKAFIDEKENENGLLSAEDAAAYEKMEQDIADLSAAIDRKRRADSLEASLSKPMNAPIMHSPVIDEPKVKTGRASDAYREGMLKALRSNFRTVSDVLQEGVDADGGYLVPDEYDRRLIEALEEENVMRRLCTKITTSGEHKINIAATTPAAAWIEEGGALTFGDATFAQTILDAHKLHVAIKVTEELLYDSMFNLESYIIRQFGRALANAEEDAFLNGDGKGKPMGLFAKETAVPTITASSANSTSLTSDDVINLIYSLKRPYRKKAAFLLNDSTLACLRKLKDQNGAYMRQPSYQAGEPDRLAGYTIHTSQYAPDNAVAFGDYSYYNIGDRGSRSFKQLTELFAGNGMIGYVAKERVDGKLVLAEAVQILSITCSKSVKEAKA